ncbi:Gfo/Idh/MocA family protein [Paenibacillus ginsengihumi]|uniref:Gfo/Idh/MocA family protein n=1 Tax=Paenibacillus ginsengihumi TaxID=431596 RepID=UPI00037EA0C7|nr:Gfo/Idh/MocA family oxidoreductase [Paenibacillus ginsengihumi]
MSEVIVVGAGHWGQNLVRTFAELNALAGVVETDSNLRKQMVEAYPSIPVYADYHDALRSDVKALAIATPAQTHFEIAKAALEAGKDVFVEKPLTLSVRESEQLVQLAGNHDRILMTGHLLLYQPAIQKIKELLVSGTIGQLQGLHQERLKLGRVRSFENVLWSFGVHDLAVFLYLTGEQAPIDIRISGQNVIQPHIVDDIYLHLQFNHNVQAHLHTSWFWPEIRRRLIVTGTEGMLVFDEEGQTLTLYRKGVRKDLSSYDDGAEVVFQSDEKPLTLECMHFIECVHERTQPLSDGHNGLAVVKILEQASKMLEGDLS